MIGSFLLKAVSSKPIGLRTFSGFIARGIFFRILKNFDSLLATRIHEMRTLSPFSLTPLEAPSQHIFLYDFVPAGVEFQFRIVSFSQDITSALQRFVLGDSSPVIEVQGVQVPVREVSVSSFENNEFDKLDADVSRFVVDFVTPTFFRNTQKGPNLLSLLLPRRFRKPVKPVYRYVIVPDPYLFFRGLARLYRQFCNPNFRYKSYCEWLLEGGVALETYYGLRVLKIHENDFRWSRGFVGRAVFAIPRDLYDSRMAKLSHRLLEFGKLCNVGGNRTAGFGVINYRVPPFKDDK